MTEKKVSCAVEMISSRGEEVFSEEGNVESLMVKDCFDISSDLSSHKIFD